MERLALRWGWVDRPAGHKYHRQAPPLLGGVAIFLATWGTLAALATPVAGSTFWVTSGASALLLFAGLWDERRDPPLVAKLVAQVAAAALLVAGGRVADLPFPSWVAVALTLLWIVGVTNALNLLDHMDGSAARAHGEGGGRHPRWARSRLRSRRLGLHHRRLCRLDGSGRRCGLRSGSPGRPGEGKRR